MYKLNLYCHFPVTRKQFSLMLSRKDSSWHSFAWTQGEGFSLAGHQK